MLACFLCAGSQQRYSSTLGPLCILGQYGVRQRIIIGYVGLIEGDEDVRHSNMAQAMTTMHVDVNRTETTGS